MSEEEIVNRVANSGLYTLNLEDYLPQTPILELDIAPWLFRGMILKEKDFRDFVKAHDWEQYQGKMLCFVCSSDAIIPTWAYMLLAVSVEPYAARYFYGSKEELRTLLFEEALGKDDFSRFADMRVIVKGCGDTPIPVQAYVKVTAKLLPFAKSIMYGEACSNVPVFKKR